MEEQDYNKSKETKNHEEANPVHGSALPEKLPLKDGYVDYQAVAKAWDKEEAGNYLMISSERQRTGGVGK